MNTWRLSATAAGDLLRIGRYSRRKWGKPHSDRYLAGLHSRFAILAERPGVGITRDEISPGLRSFPFRVHVIYYRRIATGVRVVRVLDGRRRPERLLAGH